MARLPQYDITITTSTEDIGLMLSTDDYGKKQWSMRYAPTLSEQMFMGEASYRAFPPEQEVVFAQDSFKNGFGEYDYKGKAKYFEALNVDCRHGEVILGPLINATAVHAGDTAMPDSTPYFFVFGGGLYIFAGRYGYKFDYATDEDWDEVKDCGSGKAVTGYPVEFNGNMYIPMGTGEDYYYTADGSSFTQSTLTTATVNKFAVLQDTLWGDFGNGDLRSNTSGINGGGEFSSAYQVGSSNDAVRDLFVYDGKLMILKDTGSYTLDENGDIRELFKAPPTGYESNYLSAYEWQNRGYFGTSNLGLQEYDRGRVQSLHPRLFGPRSDYSTGYARCFAGGDAYLYMGLWKTPIFAGRYQWVQTETGAEVPDFVWHPYIYISGLTENIIKSLCIHRATSENTRLWIGFYAKNATNDYRPGYIIMPGGSENPRKDPYTEYRYCASGTFITGYYNGGFVDIDKAFLSLSIWSEALSSGHYTIKAEYQKDGDSSWTEWGGTGNGTFVTSPLETKYSYAGGTSLTGKRIRFRFTLATDASTTTPAMLAFACHGVLRPTKKKLFEFTATVADGVIEKEGVVSTKQADAIASSVSALPNTVWPVTLYDPLGTSHSISVLQATEGDLILGLNDRKEVTYTILAIEEKTA